MRVDDLRSLGIFDGLSDVQLTELIDRSTEVRIEPGMELFRQGEPADFWWLLIEGVIDLIRHAGREETIVATMNVPGRWAGGFRAWDEHGTYLATGRGAAPGRVLRLPAEVLGDRTDSWFPFAGHLIRGLYNTARSFEATARQRESLVTLGTLAAGLAHEINNPASAATRAIGALETACQTLLSSLGRLGTAGVSAEQLSAVDALRRELEPGAAEADALARADREDDISSWLVEHGVSKEWTIAPSLALAGVDLEWCARAAAVLDASAFEPALEWVASSVAIEELLANVKESTRRISELVAAVKSYSQMDRASIQTINVADGIESTLTMLSHKVGEGVTVLRDYDTDVPQIDAYSAELNQVWTNLIDNALDAMDGSGTLRVATRADGDGVIIEIGDTGPGMTPEVARRAFSAFYTTKDVGKGTGLGLDIARRIVEERHGGTITITSQPGTTVLAVRLPARPPA
jgi:signal transduction histidine kinase